MVVKGTARSLLLASGLWSRLGWGGLGWSRGLLSLLLLGWDWSWLGNWSLLLVGLLVSSLLLLEVLGEELLIGHVGSSGGLPAVDLGGLLELLSSESLFSDQSLDLGGRVEGLVTLLDLSPDDVLGDIVLLSQSESLSDLANPLGTESSWLVGISESGDLGSTLLKDLEGNDAEVWTADAASDGLSLALTSSPGSVIGHSYIELVNLI